MDDFSIAIIYCLIHVLLSRASIQDRAQEEELALEQACCRCFLGADEANRSQGCTVKMFRVFSFQGATLRIDMNWQSLRLVDQGSRIGWWIRFAGFLGTCEWFHRKEATSPRYKDPVILQEGFWYWLLNNKYLPSSKNQHEFESICKNTFAGLELATMLVGTTTGGDDDDDDESIGRNDDQQEITRSEGSQGVQVSKWCTFFPKVFGAQEPWSSLQNVHLRITW